MATPLKDFRVPIPEWVHLWLAADAAAFDKDMQVIAREILKEWAKKKAKAYRVASKAMAANGTQMDWARDDEEDEGAGKK